MHWQSENLKPKGAAGGPKRKWEQDRRKEVNAPVKKKKDPTFHPSKGGPAKNLHTKWERLSVAE